MMNSENDFVGPVNMGNPDEISINDLAKRIIKLVNSNSKLIYKDLPKDDPKRRKPDISLSLDKLNWKPLYDLEVGLINTIDYFKALGNK